MLEPQAFSRVSIVNLRLSKSSDLRGLQCHKSLYLYQFHRDLQDPSDPKKQAISNTGYQVGELARELFPGGALAIDGGPRLFRKWLRPLMISLRGSTTRYRAF